MLRYLDHEVPQIADSDHRERLERMIADMRGAMGLGGATISELGFQNHQGPLSRPLLLFCLRSNCVDLLEFSEQTLSAEELLLSAVLFGVRDGWLKLPREVRNPDLSAYVMNSMARRELANRGIDLLIPEVQPPIPLRSLFGSAPKDWSDMKSRAAEELSKDMLWRDCIKTTIASDDGTPLDDPIPENGKYIFHGGIQTTTKVDHQKFLKRLGIWPPINREAEERVRKALATSISEPLPSTFS